MALKDDIAKLMKHVDENPKLDVANWCIVVHQPHGLGMSTTVYGPFTMSEAIRQAQSKGGHACEMKKD